MKTNTCKFFQRDSFQRMFRGLFVLGLILYQYGVAYSCTPVLTYINGSYSETGSNMGPYNLSWGLFNNDYSCTAYNYRLGNPVVYRSSGGSWVHQATIGVNVPSYSSFTIYTRSNGQAQIQNLTLSNVTQTGTYRVYFEILKSNGSQLPNLCQTWPGKCRLYVDINVTSISSPCSTPSNPHTNSGITSTTATPDWFGVSNVQYYQIRYRPQSGGSYIYTTSTSSYRNLVNLTPSTCYIWEVRTRCNNGSYSTWASPQSFCTLAAPCSVPSNLHTNSGITSTTATPDWFGVSSVQYYQIRYRPQSGGSYIYTTSTSSYKNLTNLTPNTCYTWEVRTRCNNGTYSTWASPQSFCTLAAPCGVPSNPHTNSGITSTTATPDWFGVSGVNYYQFQYRVQGSSFWYTYTTNSSSYYLSNLSTNTCYEWRVRTYCGTYSAWTSIQSFCTLCQPPLIASHPISKNICVGAPNAIFTVSATNLTNGTWEKNGVNLGISSQTLTISNPTISNQGSYRYRANNACGTVYSNYASLTFITPPNANFTTSGITQRGQTISLLSSANGNHGWTVTSPSNGSVVVYNSTSSSASFLASHNGTYQIVHSVGNLGCTETVTSTLDITPNYSLNRPVEASRNIKYEADPVNTANGEYKYGHSIMEIAGLNSTLNLNVFYLGRHLENRDMGFGWRHNWDIRMVRLSSPSGDLYVEFGDGRRSYFTEYTGSSPRILPTYRGNLDTLIKNGNGTYQLETQLGETFVFNNNGKLLSVSDLNNNVFNLTYNSLGKLSRVTAPGGRYISFVYTGNKLTSVSNQANQTALFSYNGLDNLIQLISITGGQFTYNYDVSHRITSITDPRGINFIQNTYDASGRVTKQQMADSGEWMLQYNTSLKTTTVTDPMGHNKTYYYDNNWNLIREDDELNLSAYLGYDTNHLLAHTVNKNGDTTHLNHDTKGNLVDFTSPLGRPIQSSYSTLNRPSSITNSLGINTGLNYDNNGNLTGISLPNTGQVNLTRNNDGTVSSITDAEGRILNYTYSTTGDLTSINTPTGIILLTYNNIGRVMSITDQNSKVTTITYDAWGNITRITSPSTAYIEFTYDANGNMVSYRDKNGNLTSYVYDNKDQLISISDPMSRVTAISRNLNNQITRIDYPNGGYTSYTYSTRGNVLTQDYNSKITTYTYTNLGLLSTVDYPNGYQVSMSYNKDGELISHSDNIGKIDVITRDNAGRISKLRNTLGVETEYTWNDMGQLIGVSHASIANSTYNVNLNGELTTVTDPNNHTTTNTINATTGRQTATTDPEGNSITVTYDNVGNPISITQANSIIETITYNDDSYPITRNWTSGYFENYTRNSLGTVTAITTPSGTMNISLNANQEPTSISDMDGNTVNYTLTNLGLPSHISFSGRNRAKIYNSSSQEVSTTDWQNDSYVTNYNSAGIPTTFTYPNGVQKIVDYRVDGYLMHLVYIDNIGDTLFYQDYTRNAMGQVLSESKPNNFIANNLPIVNDNNTYLDNDAQSNGVYNSDTRGNISQFPDGLGNTVLASYDAKNRIDTLKIGARTIINEYDAGNFLVKQIDNGIAKYYVWDYAFGLPRIIAEKDASGNITVSYVWANGILVSRIDETSGQKLFYVHDTKGNVVALMDTTGTVTDTYTYGTFGEFINHTGGTQQPFTWLGAHGIVHQFGTIYYIRQRWYDAEAGRFLSQDPYPSSATNNQTLNRYVYGLNNSLEYMDVNGLYSQDNTTRRLNRRRWRDDNRRRGFNLSFFDERGKEILGHWLNGSGDPLILVNKEWKHYMSNNQILDDLIEDILYNDASTRITSELFYYKGSAEIENGYFSGYEMLHGTSNFSMSGNANLINQNKVEYTLTLSWQDVIDPNPSYPLDTQMSNLLHTFYSPKDYSIHIFWEETFTIELN